MRLPHLRPALVLTLLLCLLTGAAYPAVVTLLARTLFPRQAEGSLIRAGGRVVGSALIGQPFAGAGYFHPRPSAAGGGYDAMASGGSNLGPTSRRLADSLVAGAVARLEAEDGAGPGRIPTDLATASGSGLDPDVSPAGAALQVRRVARARGLSEAVVRDLVDRQTEPPQFGLLGDPRVNVLRLNLALDSLTAATTPR